MGSLGFPGRAPDSPRAVVFALANAVVIAAYTAVDALGARASGNPLQYVVTLTRAPVATVAALRETSVLLGTCLLKETLSPRGPRAAAEHSFRSRTPRHGPQPQCRRR